MHFPVFRQLQQGWAHGRQAQQKCSQGWACTVGPTLAVCRGEDASAQQSEGQQRRRHNARTAKLCMRHSAPAGGCESASLSQSGMPGSGTSGGGLLLLLTAVDLFSPPRPTPAAAVASGTGAGSSDGTCKSFAFSASLLTLIEEAADRALACLSALGWRAHRPCHEGSDPAGLPEPARGLGFTCTVLATTSSDSSFCSVTGPGTGTSGFGGGEELCSVVCSESSSMSCGISDAGASSESPVPGANGPDKAGGHSSFSSTGGREEPPPAQVRASLAPVASAGGSSSTVCPQRCEVFEVWDVQQEEVVGSWAPAVPHRG